MTSTNHCTTTPAQNKAVSRILDAWCAQRRAGEARSRPLDVRTMAEIAARIMEEGQSWDATTGPIPTDVDTVWLLPGLNASRSPSDPNWWGINEIDEDRLLRDFGPVYEHEPVTDRAICGTRRVVDGHYAIPGAVVSQIQAALTGATATLDLMAERRSGYVGLDYGSRCAATARACDKAWEALKDALTEEASR